MAILEVLVVADGCMYVDVFSCQSKNEFQETIEFIHQEHKQAHILSYFYHFYKDALEGDFNPVLYQSRLEHPDA